MRVTLPKTTTSKVSKRLIELRDEGGATALGRVLTLVIITDVEHEDAAIKASNDASREHPMRVIVISTDPDRDADDDTEARLDAEILVGGDAGASEIIILRPYGVVASTGDSLVQALLLPDAPIVAWWAAQPPQTPSATSIGHLAQRRIIDSKDTAGRDAAAHLADLRRGYTPGDSDLSWTRLTTWRSMLASLLDQPPFLPVQKVTISGKVTRTETHLLAAWFGLQLGVPVELESAEVRGRNASIRSVTMSREDGEIVLDRDALGVATLRLPDQPDHTVALPTRSLVECLAEELRRLAPDRMYGLVLTEGTAAIASATGAAA